MGFNPEFQKRKTVVGSNERDLAKRVNYHIKNGWMPVGKVTVIHGAYKSEYVQVMEYVGKEVVGG